MLFKALQVAGGWLSETFLRAFFQHVELHATHGIDRDGLPSAIVHMRMNFWGVCFPWRTMGTLRPDGVPIEHVNFKGHSSQDKVYMVPLIHFDPACSKIACLHMLCRAAGPDCDTSPQLRTCRGLICCAAHRETAFEYEKEASGGVHGKQGVGQGVVPQGPFLGDRLPSLQNTTSTLVKSHHNSGSGYVQLGFHKVGDMDATTGADAMFECDPESLSREWKIP